MKPLNKAERWYAFLEIIWEGADRKKLSLFHTHYGLLSDTGVKSIAREEEIDEYVESLWENPPEFNYV